MEVETRTELMVLSHNILRNGIVGMEQELIDEESRVEFATKIDQVRGTGSWCFSKERCLQKKTYSRSCRSSCLKNPYHEAFVPKRESLQNQLGLCCFVMITSIVQHPRKHQKICKVTAKCYLRHARDRRLFVIHSFLGTLWFGAVAGSSIND